MGSIFTSVDSNTPTTTTPPSLGQVGVGGRVGGLYGIPF